jgi:hypothetical protein
MTIIDFIMFGITMNMIFMIGSAIIATIILISVGVKEPTDLLDIDNALEYEKENVYLKRIMLNAILRLIIPFWGFVSNIYFYYIIITTTGDFKTKLLNSVRKLSKISIINEYK